MSAGKLRIKMLGENVELSRDQWRGNRATISNYPGLLEEVKKHTWTFTGGIHPYLRSTKLNMSLHKFVLYFLYGQDRVETMLSHDCVIEHLDNDGLNCMYDNLHIVSSDYNKAKAFTVDKIGPSFSGIPHFVTGVFYSHLNSFYQMQIFLNDNVFWDYRDAENPKPIEELYFIYGDFDTLFIDWLYVLSCREQGHFDIEKLHANQMLAKNRPVFEVKDEERNNVIIQRDGDFFLNLKTSGDRCAFLVKPRYKGLNPQDHSEK